MREWMNKYINRAQVQWDFFQSRPNLDSWKSRDLYPDLAFEGKCGRNRWEPFYCRSVCVSPDTLCVVPKWRALYSFRVEPSIFARHAVCLDPCCGQKERDEWAVQDIPEVGIEQVSRKQKPSLRQWSMGKNLFLSNSNPSINYTQRWWKTLIQESFCLKSIIKLVPVAWDSVISKRISFTLRVPQSNGNDSYAHS